MYNRGSEGIDVTNKAIKPPGYWLFMAGRLENIMEDLFPNHGRIINL